MNIGLEMAREPSALPDELQSTDSAVFEQALRRFARLDATDVAAARALFQPRELAPRHYFLRAGERASEAAIVVRGLVREHFVLSDGTERTKAFVIEGQPTGSIIDLVSGAPSRCFIVAEEPTRLLVARFDRLLALVERSAGFRRYGERLTLAVLASKAEREYELLGLDAEARYQRFLARYPGLEARVAAHQIASYLGITPVHLSRLRRRRRQGKAAAP